ncbi:MAG: hypothetical protein HOL17_00905 [Gammaproteobacteria bacterium]|nr:hypothetical protein [Gammaproteobacteria bacterium]MBT5370264.1 hypothetical protein [Gammaproteobacteria bacterium]
MVSKKRGKQSNHAYPGSLNKYVIQLVRDNYQDFGPTLISEKLEERHEGTI